MRKVLIFVCRKEDNAAPCYIDKKLYDNLALNTSLAGCCGQCFVSFWHSGKR